MSNFYDQLNVTNEWGQTINRLWIGYQETKGSNQRSMFVKKLQNGQTSNTQSFTHTEGLSAVWTVTFITNNSDGTKSVWGTNADQGWNVPNKTDSVTFTLSSSTSEVNVTDTLGNTKTFTVYARS